MVHRLKPPELGRFEVLSVNTNHKYTGETINVPNKTQVFKFSSIGNIKVFGKSERK